MLLFLNVTLASYCCLFKYFIYQTLCQLKETTPLAPASPDIEQIDALHLLAEVCSSVSKYDAQCHSLKVTGSRALSHSHQTQKDISVESDLIMSQCGKTKLDILAEMAIYDGRLDHFKGRPPTKQAQTATSRKLVLPSSVLQNIVCQFSTKGKSKGSKNADSMLIIPAKKIKRTIFLKTTDAPASDSMAVFVDHTYHGEYILP